MYLGFYGLKREPFHITPDPDFLFMSESHKQALGSIIYGIQKKKGFIAITGSVGVGKTTIVRSYIDKETNRDLRTIYVFNSNITFEVLARTICRELNLEAGDGDPSEMVNRLHLELIDRYSSGQTIVLIIDEAQNMPVETLENLRMLSNLETSKEKLVQIVLIGQPEFDEMLERHELRQLKQRIAIRTVISPLKGDESLEYINHRLSRAGLKNKSVFTRNALRLIMRNANGIPRLLNVLCDNALLTGYGYQQNPVTSRMVKEVIVDFDKKRKALVFRWRFLAILSPVILFAVLLFSFYQSAVSSRVATRDRFRSSGIKVERKTKTSKPVLNSAQVDRQIPAQAAQTPGAYRVIKKGDTLTGLVTDIYRLDSRHPKNWELIHAVKETNPGILDVNRIRAGDKIVFPHIKSEADSKPRNTADPLGQRTARK
ncbi:MAG: AAA family ATPase [Pseudomonadota bacterium]